VELEKQEVHQTEIVNIYKASAITRYSVLVKPSAASAVPVPAVKLSVNPQTLRLKSPVNFSCEALSQLSKHQYSLYLRMAAQTDEG